ncbi:predicted protein [Naegleria gruberi]|uniref:Predicted protein n=1 Tax=Naegleria gruberi TaxID=5762 RepID=D2VWG7_NAEGR|nr:uncharacterized protein NAEGRDRAFT_52811 [Naegleria gruberi]EFC38893.1 predicted protein [Naegleria gruberi]|eukprot:XP_002671637.1 predicted protein [Naegleria gruberi strain NEG-M]
MGQINTTIRSHVQKQYQLVKKKPEREYLTIEEAKKLQSLDEYPIDFKKLAVLFMLDFDKNGKFSLDDLMKFTDWCGSVTEHLKTDQHGFKSELQAQCTLHMWKQINTARNGKKVFGDWFVRVFSVGHIIKLPKHPKTHWVSIDTASVIYELLSIKELYGISTQQFIDLMQAVGEEKGLMPRDEEDLDEVVPTEVIHDFAVAFITGFLNMMSSLGFSPQKYLTTSVALNVDNLHSVGTPENTNQPNSSTNEVTNTQQDNVKPVPMSFPIPKLSGIGSANTQPKPITTPITTTAVTSPTEDSDEYSSDESDGGEAQKPEPTKLGIPSLKLNTNNATVPPSFKLNIPTKDTNSSNTTNTTNLPTNNLAVPKMSIPGSKVDSIVHSGSGYSLSPTASAFLLQDQNNLEKLEEKQFSEEDLSEKDDPASDDSDYSSEDDIEDEPPKEVKPSTKPVIPALSLNLAGAKPQPSTKPFIPTLSMSKATTQQPTETDKVSVNGISMKKLKL